MTFLRLSLAALCLITLPHCSSESDADSGESAGGRGGGGGESRAVDRGPTTLAIEGDPNGLWWSESEQTLYVADDNGNRILRWTDEDGFSLVADLPSAAPEGAGLGQLVVLGDGTLVVTRFGYGTAGDVVSIAPSGEASVVPGLDPLRRRIGLTVDADGNLFDSWFVRVENGDRVGAVGALDLEGDERIVLEGLKKPVGVLALGDHLFVADQDLGQILKAVARGRVVLRLGDRRRTRLAGGGSGRLDLHGQRRR